ncbi:MAG: hypothetical protein J7647_23845 [Cyanobacteria bacterium SBLK]|nr:hypothetical protein [Cyanobacteria bacterium SBLK]
MTPEFQILSESLEEQIKYHEEQIKHYAKQMEHHQNKLEELKGVHRKFQKLQEKQSR